MCQRDSKRRLHTLPHEQNYIGPDRNRQNQFLILATVKDDVISRSRLSFGRANRASVGYSQGLAPNGAVWLRECDSRLMKRRKQRARMICPTTSSLAPAPQRKRLMEIDGSGVWDRRARTETTRMIEINRIDSPGCRRFERLTSAKNPL